MLLVVARRIFKTKRFAIHRNAILRAGVLGRQAVHRGKSPDLHRVSVIAFVFSPLLWPIFFAMHADDLVSQSLPIDDAPHLEINDAPIAMQVERDDRESLTLSTEEREIKELSVTPDSAHLSIDHVEHPCAWSSN